MNITQISEHIWKLGIWMIVPIQVWVVKENDGVTLIDTGIELMAGGILRFLRELDAGPLKRILLTHAHPDHVGAIEKIRQQYPVPVFLHTREKPYAEGELPYPRRKKSKIFIKPGTVTELEELKGKLVPLGSLVPYHTPGHSPGHVVYYHEQDNVLIGGDLFTTGKNKLKRPISLFTGNMEEAIRSASIIQILKPRLLSVSHGRDLNHPDQYYKPYVQKWGDVKVQDNVHTM